MKKLNNCKWFVLGIAVCLVCVTMVVPALAAAFTTKTAQLEYSGMKIALNGNTVTPKDANGKAVEPFVIDGTTYLPVRAIGNALGMGVDWDSNTNTVKLTRQTMNAGQQAVYIGVHSVFDMIANLQNLLLVMDDEINTVGIKCADGTISTSDFNNTYNSKFADYVNNGDYVAKLLANLNEYITNCGSVVDKSDQTGLQYLALARTLRDDAKNIMNDQQTALKFLYLAANTTGAQKDANLKSYSNYLDKAYSSLLDLNEKCAKAQSDTTNLLFDGLK